MVRSFCTRFKISVASRFLQFFYASMNLWDIGWLFQSILTGEAESSVKNRIWPNFRNLTRAILVRFIFWHWIPSFHSKYFEKFTPHIIGEKKNDCAKMVRSFCALFKISVASRFLQFFYASMNLWDIGWLFQSILTGEAESSVKNRIWPNFRNLTRAILVRFNFWHWIQSFHSKYLEK